MILGLDLSLNHAGLVGLDDAGVVSWFDYVTDKKSACRGGKGVLLKQETKERAQRQIERIAWWDRYLSQLFTELLPTHIALEDYAFTSKQNSVYETGELGGLARYLAVQGGGKLRLHDPASVKLFATGKGNATGADVAVQTQQTACPDGWVDLQQLVREDLAAAYFVARLAWVELELRAGRLTLEGLTEQQRRPFLRTTKANPTNLLARDWLTVGGARG